MRLDLGISNYNYPEKLDECLRALRLNSTTDWRCLVVDNMSTDPKVKEVLERHASEEPRIIPRYMT